MSMTPKKKMIIVGANSSAGQKAASYFCHEYDCLLLDFNASKLKATQKKYAPNATILPFDITSTVHLVGLVTYLKRRGSFDYVLNLLDYPEEDDNVALVYKVNLLGTKQLHNYLYPLIAQDGIIINISSITPPLLPLAPDTFLLLNDPLQNTFVTQITAQTTSIHEAFVYATYGVCLATERDIQKWELKAARILTILHDVHTEDDHKWQSFFTKVHGLLINTPRDYVGICLNYTANDDLMTIITL